MIAFSCHLMIATLILQDCVWLACKGGHFEVAQYIVAQGADANTEEEKVIMCRNDSLLLIYISIQLIIIRRNITKCQK